MSLGGQKEAEAWIFIDRDPGFGDGLPWNCTGPSRGGRFLPGNIDRLDRAGASDTVPSVSPASRPYRSHLKVPVSLVPSGLVIPFAAARANGLKAGASAGAASRRPRLAGVKGLRRQGSKPHGRDSERDAGQRLRARRHHVPGRQTAMHAGVRNKTTFFGQMSFS